MSGRYSTNWDRKGWPGTEIQMYYTAARAIEVFVCDFKELLTQWPKDCKLHRNNCKAKNILYFRKSWLIRSAPHHHFIYINNLSRIFLKKQSQRIIIVLKYSFKDIRIRKLELRRAVSLIVPKSWNSTKGVHTIKISRTMLQNSHGYWNSLYNKCFVCRRTMNV